MSKLVKDGNLHSSSANLGLGLVVDLLIRHRHGEALKSLHSVLVGLINIHGKVGSLLLHLRQLLTDHLQDVVPRLHGLKKLIHLLLVDFASVRKESAPACVTKLRGQRTG